MGELNKLLWSKRLQVLFFFLLVVVIILISIASLIQTEAAFRIMNDVGLTIFTIPLGIFLSWCFAIFIQYSQNAALYVAKHYCNNMPVVRWQGFKWVTTKNVAIGWFIFACAIDAVTNMLWYYNRTQAMPRPNLMLNIATDFVIYSLMILCVFVEEVLGLCLDILVRARRELAEMTAKIKVNKTSAGVVAKKTGYTPPTRPATPSVYKPTYGRQMPLKNLNDEDKEFKPLHYGD
jgi:hypothetical protein